MKKRLSFEGGPWWRFDRYCVRHGYIRPAPDARLHEYDPWELHYSGMREGGEAESPYASLLALAEHLVFVPNPEYDRSDYATVKLGPKGEEMLLSWCQRYGLLGLLHALLEKIMLPARWHRRKDTGNSYVGLIRVLMKECGQWTQAGISLPMVHRRKAREGEIIPLSLIPSELKPHVLLRTSLGGHLEQSLDAIYTYFPGVPEKEAATFQYPALTSREFWPLYAEPVLLFAQQVTNLREGLAALSRAAKRGKGEPGSVTLLNGLLADIAPYVARGAMPSLQWRSPSLLSSLALMAVQDLTLGKRVFQCETCDRAFVADSKRARYCSARCRGTMQMRRYRQGLRARHQSKGENDLEEES